MQGKVVDLDLLIKRNELTPAVGNAKVNARGDELGPGGNIIRKREEVVNEYQNKGSEPIIHEGEAIVTPQEKAELDEFDNEEVPAKPTPAKVALVKDKLQNAKLADVQPKKPIADKQPASVQLDALVTESDEWVEDDEGNFVRKG